MRIINALLILCAFSAYAWTGCPYGTWGPQCKELCGSCYGGDQFCQSSDGLCTTGCASGYTGLHCKENCRPGTYGPYCRHNCGNCVPPDCDQATGMCVACKPGFQMPWCDRLCPAVKKTGGEPKALTEDCQNTTSRSTWYPEVAADCMCLSILFGCAGIIVIVFWWFWRTYRVVVRPVASQHDKQGQQKKKFAIYHQQVESTKVAVSGAPTILHFVSSKRKCEKIICNLLTVPGSIVYDSICWLKSDVWGQRVQIKQVPVNTTQCILFSGLHPASNTHKRSSRQREIKTDAKKQLLISKPPEILRLHLKRFRWCGRNNREKIGTHVAFDEEFDISPFCQTVPTVPRYRLHSVVVHHGAGFRSGHYTTLPTTSMQNLITMPSLSPL